MHEGTNEVWESATQGGKCLFWNDVDIINIKVLWSLTLYNYVSWNNRWFGVSWADIRSFAQLNNRKLSWYNYAPNPLNDCVLVGQEGMSNCYHCVGC